MMDFITVPLTTGIIVLGIYKLFELFACRRERIMLIEKGNGSLPDGKAAKRYGLPLSFSTLKCGCLLLGYLICAASIPGFLEGNFAYYGLPSLVFGACVLLMGGVGLLVAFIIELRLGKRGA